MDPWLSVSAVHGTVPGFHTGPWVPGGLFCLQWVARLRL
jgi:hypothetical protein